MPHNYRRKPFALVQFKFILLQLDDIRWQIHHTHGLCCFRYQDTTMLLDTMSLLIGKLLAGANSQILLTHCSYFCKMFRPVIH